MQDHPDMNHINLYTAFHLDPNASCDALDSQLSQLLGTTDPSDTGLRNQIDVTRRILSDPERRSTYDRQLADPTAPRITPGTLQWLASMEGAAPAAAPVRKKRRILLAAGAVTLIGALVLSVSFFTGDRESGPTQAAHCSDVEFIGAAGSGQRDDQVNSGVGSIVEQTYDNLRADLPDDTSLALHAVDYPALAVPRSVDSTDWDPYFESIETGSASTRQLITTTMSECPDSQIIVAGYSQGAMAVRRALQELGPSDQIVGAVLIGDGDKRPDDNVATLPEYGTDQYRGIAQIAREELSITSGAGEEPLGTDWETRVLSACISSDIVCALGSFDLGSIAESLSAHSSYDADDWRDFLPGLVTP